MKKFYSTALCLALASSGVAFAQSVVAVRGAEAQTVRKSAAMHKASADRMVIAEKPLAKGVSTRIVRDADGFVYRTVVKNGVESSRSRSLKKPRRAAAANTFFEGFEGHQGELDWIPDGWTEINTDGNKCTPEMAKHNINNSWSVQDTGDGYWTDITSDGVKECWIHFTYNWSYTDDQGEKVSGEAAPQDEWLITPSISVKQGDGLFFLMEFDLGAVWAFSWDDMSYDREDLENDMEVLISTDDGANWTSLWKVSEDVCADMTDQQMYDAMAELKYASYSIPLTDYYGKDVKIAFRYTNVSKGGFSGNSAAVDAVTVGAPSPEAFYNLPYGTLLAGVSADLHAYTESYALFPAYESITWNAASNSYTEKNSWEFYDVETEDFGPAQEADEASIEYPYSSGKAFPFPKLTASNANSSDTFFFGQGDEEQGGMIFGGSIPDITEDEPVYVGNYDYPHKRLVITNLGDDAYCYGTAPADTWGDGVVQESFGNLFYAPEAPFTVTDVIMTLGEYDADPDAEFTLDIYTADDTGQLTDKPVATAKLKGSDITGLGFYNAKFHLEEPYTLDSTTLMLISGFADTDKVRTFAGCAQGMSNDEAHNYAYMMFRFDNGTKQLYSASEALQDYSSALILSLQGTFHVMHSESEIVDLDTQTNSVDVPLTVTGTPDLWYIVADEEKIPVAQEGTDHEWLKVTPVDNGDGKYSVRFSAEPNADDRAMTLYMANGGNPMRIRVRQTGTNGIAAVTSGKGTIHAADGVITVAGYEGQTVTVVNAAGVGVARAASAPASLSLPVAPGFYVVKAGTDAVKVIVK